MAEFEVYASLEGETDIEISFKKMSRKAKWTLIKSIIFGQKVTFPDVYVELNGDTFVEIEPMERY